ncbi:MAG: hypothetical protein EBQ56_08350 [Proteobacteria bacterium]|nr:hypothetical protein [Pseudomonadota bacterium]
MDTGTGSAMPTPEGLALAGTVPVVVIAPVRFRFAITARPIAESVQASWQPSATVWSEFSDMAKPRSRLQDGQRPSHTPGKFSRASKKVTASSTELNALDMMVLLLTVWFPASGPGGGGGWRVAVQ